MIKTLAYWAYPVIMAVIFLIGVMILGYHLGGWVRRDAPKTRAAVRTVTPIMATSDHPTCFAAVCETFCRLCPEPWLSIPHTLGQYCVTDVAATIIYWPTTVAVVRCRVLAQDNLDADIAMWPEWPGGAP